MRRLSGAARTATSTMATTPPSAPSDTVVSARSLAGRWLGRHGGPLALLAGLTWALFYPFSANMREGLATWGDPMLQYWTMAWPVHLLQTDLPHLPQRLFEANIFWPYPHTLAYTDHLLGATLLVLPAILLSGQVAFGLNLAVLLMTFLTALGAYLWVSDLTGNRVAGFAAALPVAFAPYKLANIAHLHTLASGGLVLALWALTRLWRGGSRRWSALLAGGVAFQGLTSIYFFYALLVGLGVTLGYLALAERRAIRWWRLSRVAVGLAVGLTLLLPFFLPYLWVTRDLGVTRTIDEALGWSAAPNWYLRVSRNNFFWADKLRQFGAGSPERLLFPGALAPVLALVGLVASRRRERWLFLGLAGAGFLLTLGPYQDVGAWRVPLPYWLLYEVVPGFSALRVPTRFVVLVLLGLGGLAGLGVEALALGAARWLARRRTGAVRRSAGPRRKARAPGTVAVSRRVAVAGLLGGLAALTGLAGVDYATHTGNTGAVAGAIDAPVYRWLATNGAGPVVELPFPSLAGVSGLTNLASTVYWRPNLGGYSGFVPPAYDGMQKILATFPDPAAISLLQGLEVQHIVLHADQFSPDQRLLLARALPAVPALREVARLGSDFVYELTPNPWMNALVRMTPPGAAVTFPDVDAEPTQTELLAVFFRRAGHSVSGSGTAGYHRFSMPAGGALPPYAVIASASDPLLYGYLPSEATSALEGFTLYHRGAGARAALLLSDPALAGAAGGSSALALRIDDGAISAASDFPSAARGAPRAALVAFVNAAPGEVTIRSGRTIARETLPAGLVVYRTVPIATPGAVTIEAPPGGRLYARWARLDDGGPPGIVYIRQLVLLDASTRSTDRATAVISAWVLPALVADGAPLTVTLDIYQRPYGVHPDGHYGYWSIVVPPGGQARAIEFTFNAEAKSVEAKIDGSWIPVIAWTGPPHEWGFRAALTVHRGEQLLGTAPLFEFELQDWRVRDLALEQPSPRFLPPRR